VGAGPVGDDEAFVAPVFFQDLVEEVVVFAGVVAVDLVVGAHDGGGLRDGDGDLEGEQVALTHGTLVEQNVEDVAAGLLSLKA